MRTKLVLVGILLLASISFLSAQTPNFQIELKKIEIRNDLNSPTFPDQIDKQGSKPLKKWALLSAKYTVTFANIKTGPGALDNGKWLDTVSVDWQFLYKPEKAPNIPENYIKFGEEVTYSNITEGEHTALIFIDPTTLQRYFDEGKSIKKEINLKLSFKANGLKQKIMIGQTVFEAAYMEEGKLVRAVTKITEEAFVTDRIRVVPNIVLPRNKTPFSAIQHDNFDTIIEVKK